MTNGKLVRHNNLAYIPLTPPSLRPRPRPTSPFFDSLPSNALFPFHHHRIALAEFLDRHCKTRVKRALALKGETHFILQTRTMLHSMYTLQPRSGRSSKAAITAARRWRPRTHAVVPICNPSPLRSENVAPPSHDATRGLAGSALRPSLGLCVEEKKGIERKDSFSSPSSFRRGGGRESEITEKQKNKGVLGAHFLSHPVGAQVTQARPGGQGAEQGGGTLPDARDQQTTNALTPLPAQEKSVPPTTQRAGNPLRPVLPK